MVASCWDTSCKVGPKYSHGERSFTWDDHQENRQVLMNPQMGSFAFLHVLFRFLLLLGKKGFVAKKLSPAGNAPPVSGDGKLLGCQEGSMPTTCHHIATSDYGVCR